MKTNRPNYAVIALTAGLLELFFIGASEVPVTWVIGLLCWGGSMVAQMVRSVVAPSAISEPRGWTASYAGAGAAPRKTAFRSTSVFDESPNGRGGINEVFSGDDPFGEFL